MRNHDFRFKTGSVLSISELCVFGFSFLIVLGLYGCAVVDFANPELPPYSSTIAAEYAQIELKTSNAADVLGVIYLPDEELLSQSTSVIAALGEKKVGYKMWLKMVAFDENELSAQRKYLLIEDEKPKTLFVEPWTYVWFDCEMVLEQELLDQPYADENARQDAILRRVLENVRKDIKEVSSDNKSIAICGMLINQGLEAALLKLKDSPAEAKRLDTTQGLKFEHMTLDKGKIQMELTDDVVVVKMRLGSIVKKRLGMPDMSFEDEEPEDPNSNI